MVTVCGLKIIKVGYNFFETHEKTPKIVKLLTNILGAIFASNPVGYEPKNIFCFPACTSPCGALVKKG